MPNSDRNRDRVRSRPSRRRKSARARCRLRTPPEKDPLKRTVQAGAPVTERRHGVSRPISGPVAIAVSRKLVGVAGFDPATPSSRTRRFIESALNNQRQGFTSQRMCRRIFAAGTPEHLRVSNSREAAVKVKYRDRGIRSRVSATLFARKTQIIFSAHR